MLPNIFDISLIANYPKIIGTLVSQATKILQKCRRAYDDRRQQDDEGEYQTTKVARIKPHSSILPTYASKFGRSFEFGSLGRAHKKTRSRRAS